MSLVPKAAQLLAQEFSVDDHISQTAMHELAESDRRLANMWERLDGKTETTPTITIDSTIPGHPRLLVNAQPTRPPARAGAKDRRKERKVKRQQKRKSRKR